MLIPHLLSLLCAACKGDGIHKIYFKTFSLNGNALLVLCISPTMAIYPFTFKWNGLILSFSSSVRTCSITSGRRNWYYRIYSSVLHCLLFSPFAPHTCHVYFASGFCLALAFSWHHCISLHVCAISAYASSLLWADHRVKTKNEHYIRFSFFYLA